MIKQYQMNKAEPQLFLEQELILVMMCINGGIQSMGIDLEALGKHNQATDLPALNGQSFWGNIWSLHGNYQDMQLTAKRIENDFVYQVVKTTKKLLKLKMWCLEVLKWWAVSNEQIRGWNK